MVENLYKADSDLLNYLVENDLIKAEQLDSLMKANRAGLVPVQLTVSKNGKTFQQTFWKTPQEAKALLRKQQKPVVMINDKDWKVDDEDTLSKFCGAVTAAKKTCNPTQGWRVADDHSEDDYRNNHDKLFISNKGSTIAVTNDGDIISVCKHKDDTLSGKDLLMAAVKQGGKKLDSYDGNYNFYVKCGFEPVSYCEFNRDFMSDDWKQMEKDGKVKPEHIIFFKYTGKKTKMSMKEFYNTVPPCKGYTDKNGEFVDPYTHAMENRDKEIKK